MPNCKLALRNLHTEEYLDTVYWADGQYLAEATARIDHLLRDHRSGEVAVIDPRPLGLLFLLNQSLESTAAIEVIYGYRAQVAWVSTLVLVSPSWTLAGCAPGAEWGCSLA